MSVHHKILALAVVLSLAGCQQKADAPAASTAAEDAVRAVAAETEVPTDIQIAEKITRLLESFPEKWEWSGASILLGYHEKNDDVSIHLGYVSEESYLTATDADLAKMAARLSVTLDGVPIPELSDQKFASGAQILIAKALRDYIKLTHDRSKFEATTRRDKAVSKFLSTGAK